MRITSALVNTVLFVSGVAVLFDKVLVADGMPDAVPLCWAVATTAMRSRLESEITRDFIAKPRRRNCGEVAYSGYVARRYRGQPQFEAYRPLARKYIPHGGTFTHQQP